MRSTYFLDFNKKNKEYISVFALFSFIQMDKFAFYILMIDLCYNVNIILNIQWKLKVLK